MPPENAVDFRLTVLNPGGRDREQQFRSVPGPGEGEHPPINFHAFAACTSGAFHRDSRLALAEQTPVLLLLRSDFRASQRALTDLKKKGRKVAVSLKETGLHQFAQQLTNPTKFARLVSIVRDADGCIATTPEAAEIYRRIRSKRDPATVGFIPTPYPIEDKRWDFSARPDKRSGIFVGTREWDVPSRNHLAALLIARQLCEATNEPVTVFNLDGNKGRRLLEELRFPGGKLHLIEKWKPYPDYLRDVARHKIVLQLDRSHVPGQVAGDALLCRIPCVGGDGAIDRIAFPKSCGEGRTIGEISSIGLSLLKDSALSDAIVEESRGNARQRISFESACFEVAKFFEQLDKSRP
ncbi:MAG: hypothetical protein ACM3KL_00550 [Alphaproteobacteria bacterium]